LALLVDRRVQPRTLAGIEQHEVRAADLIDAQPGARVLLEVAQRDERLLVLDVQDDPVAPLVVREREARLAVLGHLEASAHLAARVDEHEASALHLVEPALGGPPGEQRNDREREQGEESDPPGSTVGAFEAGETLQGGGAFGARGHGPAVSRRRQTRARGPRRASWGARAAFGRPRRIVRYACGGPPGERRAR